MNRNVAAMNHEELVHILLFSECPIARETVRIELRARLQYAPHSEFCPCPDHNVAVNLTGEDLF
jgi:hypothetical protein